MFVHTVCAAHATASAPPVRLALLEFATDDNSYASIQAGIDLANLVQIELASLSGYEWIERAQIKVVRNEFHLQEMGLLNGTAALSRGKMAKADWIVTGMFSLDDRSRCILSVEVTDVHHADVLAASRILVTDDPVPVPQLKSEHVSRIATQLRLLLGQARQTWEQATTQLTVAPLFFADVSAFSSGFEKVFPETAFVGALEKIAVTNHDLRLVRFPKAYQSTKEAEMVLDCLVDVDPTSWQKTADLYVWGTHTRTFERRSGQSLRQLTFYAWNGGSEPVTFSTNLQTTAALEFQNLLATFLAQSITAARQRPAATLVSSDTRKRLADSLIGAHYAMTRSNVTPINSTFESDRLLQAIHLLETACFFDPDSAEADALRITCRWGLWTRFDQDVRNQFWTEYRRCQAWMRYADRFGSRTNSAHLPFVSTTHDFAHADIEALQELLRAFPQNFDDYDKKDAWTAIKEAQAHGFPKEIPSQVAEKWKAQVQDELAQRQKRAFTLNFSELRRHVIPTNSVAKRLSGPANASIPNANVPSIPSSPIAPQQPSPSAIFPPPTAGSANRLIPAPDWLSHQLRMPYGFVVFPPNPVQLDSNLRPEVFRFPEHFEIEEVVGICEFQSQILVTTQDKRRASSSAEIADISQELRVERRRIWITDPATQTCRLFHEEVVPEHLNSCAAAGERLWIAGDPSGWLDSSGSFHLMGQEQGFRIGRPSAFALVGTTLFAADGGFGLAQLPPGSEQWLPVTPPRRWSLSSGTGSPTLTAAFGDQLVYASGTAWLYSQQGQTWSALPDIRNLQSVCADASGIWFGSWKGLYHFAPGNSKLTEHLAPVTLEGPSSQMAGLPFTGDVIQSDMLEPMSSRVEKWLTQLEEKRRSAILSGLDPLQLQSRIPGDVLALAAEGDYLWVGTGRVNSTLLCIHKPTLSVVSACGFPRDIQSLLITSDYVWVGSGFETNLLFRLPRKSMSMAPSPQSQPLAITAAERKRIINSMTPREQAVYAFRAGDDARVRELLSTINPEKANLDQLFCLAVSSADDDSINLKQASELIAVMDRRWPGSPWAAAAKQCVTVAPRTRKDRAWQRAMLLKYDLDHDGRLDAVERTALEKDPEYLDHDKNLQSETIDVALQQIIERYDKNKDGRLDRDELQELSRNLTLFYAAPPNSRTRILLAPLLAENPPSADRLLSKYDQNHNKALEPNELKAFAVDIKKSK